MTKYSGNTWKLNGKRFKKLSIPLPKLLADKNNFSNLSSPKTGKVYPDKNVTIKGTECKFNCENKMANHIFPSVSHLRVACLHKILASCDVWGCNVAKYFEVLGMWVFVLEVYLKVSASLSSVLVDLLKLDFCAHLCPPAHLTNLVVLILPLRHIVTLYLHILVALLLYMGHQISKWVFTSYFL